MIKTLNKALAGLAVAMGIAFGSTAHAAPNHMPESGRTSQPIGHAIFCRQYPQECNVRGHGRELPKLTRKRWADMVAINNHANMSVEPVTDADHYGVEEHWTYPRSYGDCEDYVLLKRYMLMQRGWPASSLLITVVKQPNGEGHAVLTVRTDRADYVLDNLDGRIRQWNETSYKYLKRQSRTHTGRWTSIRDGRTRVARY